MLQAGLVLEGGGMRGVYTAGVLDFFLEQGIDFPFCYGVSAGSCHACSYFSRQKGRAFATNVDYLKDKRYCSAYSLLTTGDLFGAKMLYDTIPNELYPYDYEAFSANPAEFYAVLTNCRTGLPEYYRVRDMRSDIIAVRASSSLPMLSRMVKIGTEDYLDGGIADPIPIARSIADGNRKNVVVLTQHRGYQKQPNSMLPLIRMRYRNYPNLIEAMATRHIRYNESTALVQAEEAEGRAFVIQPSAPVEIGRIEKDREKLTALYRSGYTDAAECCEQLLAFMAE
jgi:predicted patatin/cPLA2 family phospholipase